MKRLVRLLIRGYQKTLSPDHGLFKVFYPYGCCRYTPSCSQYAYEAVGEHGVLKGLGLAVRRVGKCHPWAEGGHDPVPKRKKERD